MLSRRIGLTEWSADGRSLRWHDRAKLSLREPLFDCSCGCRTLEVLQDQVEPGPVEDVAEVLQRELGAPASQLFAEFEPEARAAASLAQVLPPCPHQYSLCTMLPQASLHCYQLMCAPCSPVHPCMSTSLCVHHAAPCMPTWARAYVCITLPPACLHRCQLMCAPCCPSCVPKLVPAYVCTMLPHAALCWYQPIDMHIILSHAALHYLSIDKHRTYKCSMHELPASTMSISWSGEDDFGNIELAFQSPTLNVSVCALFTCCNILCISGM